MGNKDLNVTEWRKRALRKLGFSRSRNQNDGSDSNYVEAPQQHQIGASINEPTAVDDRSDFALANPNRVSQTQEAIAPASNLLISCQSEKSPGLEPDCATIRELWNVAYEKLREEDGALIKNYESKLQGDIIAGLGLTIGSNASLRDRMQTILKHKMEEINQHTWKLRFSSSEIEVRDLVHPVLEVVNFVNEYITGAVSANPFASIAWTGISILLPVSCTLHALEGQLSTNDCRLL